jgi:serine/threonine protein kinase
MGEVYRARDTRLGRDVAIKVLPQHLSSNPDLKARFEREARAISALSHPHICHLYDIGSQNGTDYLVMELLEGESLADRLQKGAMPLKQALEVGTQIAEALEKAHKQGILHRDLKPGNIMLTKSGAKLLDFGLAKPVQSMAAMASATAETMSKPLTDEGKIVGTYQYMAPEQIQGQQADARTDIFALGAVLYEAVTGKRAFPGKSQISVMSAILEKEPEPITSAQPLSPPALDHVIRRALAKERDERWQSAADVRAELKWIAEGGSQSAVSLPIVARHRRLAQAGWLVAALLLLVVVLGIAWWSSNRNAPAMYFSTPFRMSANYVSLSPDGRKAALVAYSEQANKYMLWTYDLGGKRASAIAGTEDASHPFWSPDSRSVGFFAQGKLKRVDVVGGGSPQVLCDAPHGRGGTWNKEGVIVFAPDIWVGLHRVSAGGGTPVEITQPDASQFEQSHRWPMFLPDGRHFVYLAANFSGRPDENKIYVGSLGSNEKYLVVKASSNAAYAAPGYLLYVRDNALVAQKFDTSKYALSGDSRVINDEVQYLPQIDLAIFSVGANALLAQVGKGSARSQLTWFDRSGKQIATVGTAAVIQNPALSPDGRRVAFNQTDKDGRLEDVWVRDLGSDAALRLTFSPGLNELPVWSPDGKRIAYLSNRQLKSTLDIRNADGSGAERMISEHPKTDLACWDWSRDGRYLLIGKGRELWYMTLPDEQMKPLFQGNWIVRNAQFSPDGKWIAYASNETGNWEVYVSPFPSLSSRWQVSNGGEEPRWRNDGKELFYLSSENKMMAVPVKLGSNFEAGTPVTLFQTHLRQLIASADLVRYDVSADGQKFLINSRVDEPNAAPLSVVLNWAAEMER